MKTVIITAIILGFGLPVAIQPIGNALSSLMEHLDEVETFVADHIFWIIGGCTTLMSAAYFLYSRCAKAAPFLFPLTLSKKI